MVTLPRHRVQEVHLWCRFCAYYHFNTWNKGIAYLPGKIFDESRSSNLPCICRNIPHAVRPEYRKNLPVTALIQLRQEAGKAAYEAGVLEPYRSFEYQSSSSQSPSNN